MGMCCMSISSIMRDEKKGLVGPAGCVARMRSWVMEKRVWIRTFMSGNFLFDCTYILGIYFGWGGLVSTCRKVQGERGHGRTDG